MTTLTMKRKPRLRRHPTSAQHLRVGRRREFSMTAIMVNIFDVDINVLVARGLLPVHLRDSRDSIAQAIQCLLGAAIPALADGSLPMPREIRQRASSHPHGGARGATPR